MFTLQINPSVKFLLQIACFLVITTFWFLIAIITKGGLGVSFLIVPSLFLTPEIKKIKKDVVVKYAVIELRTYLSPQINRNTVHVLQTFDTLGFVFVYLKNVVKRIFWDVSVIERKIHMNHFRIVQSVAAILIQRVRLINLYPTMWFSEWLFLAEFFLTS